MKWFALIGLLLFIGVAVSPSINADLKESEHNSVKDKKFDNMVGLIDGIISNYERTYGPLPEGDCECELEEPTPWPFPVICTVLFILNWPFFILFFLTRFQVEIRFFINIAQDFGCWWAGPPVV